MLNSIINAAVDALLEEVSLHPKPGLVDKYDQGSHSDMDISTFYVSAESLKPFFEEYLRFGLTFTGSPQELFCRIREIGIRAEEAMLESTQKINTHKGANFIFGVILSAIGYSDFAEIDSVLELIKDMTSGIVERELINCKSAKTFGEFVYKEYGISGIRGEVESGLKLVKDHCLPILSNATETYEVNLKLCLLKLIQLNDDTNMIKRGGIEGLKLGKELSCMHYFDLDSHLSLMNTIFKERNLSPGGSADLLAVSIFLHKYRFILERKLQEASFFL